MTFDRRTILLTGTWGLGALLIPGVGWGQTVATARGFTHAVASGEPGQDTMLLWSRYVPTDGGAVKLRADVSESADFAKIVTGGAIITGPWRDHTAKITVVGLKPGTRYFYRFVAPDGSFSPTGRTKTLPDGAARSFKAAIFSCANRAFGYFNAYAHAATRNDLDLAIHLGDYLYEEKVGTYPRLADVVPGREHVPATKLVHLADYRLRYASYRADPALLALHMALPMIHQRDDHEAANNAWEGGAEGNVTASGVVREFIMKSSPATK